MVFVFETDNWEVWEGPPVGDILKYFIFKKGLRETLKRSGEMLDVVNVVLDEMSRKMDHGDVLLMKALDDIKIMKKDALPEEVLGKLAAPTG